MAVDNLSPYAFPKSNPPLCPSSINRVLPAVVPPPHLENRSHLEAGTPSRTAPPLGSAPTTNVAPGLSRSPALIKIDVDCSSIVRSPHHRHSNRVAFPAPSFHCTGKS